MTKVMIAEDDLLTADMLRDTLVENGYEVCGIASTVDKAVELGERHNPDLAILDIRLAEGGLGTEIPARIKNACPMGVLYASGHVGKLGLTKADGEALLTKPYRPEDVIRALKIVQQIVSTDGASRQFPKGFSVLDTSPKGATKSDSTTPRLTKKTGGFADNRCSLQSWAASLLVNTTLTMFCCKRPAFVPNAWRSITAQSTDTAPKKTISSSRPESAGIWG